MQLQNTPSSPQPARPTSASQNGTQTGSQAALTDPGLSRAQTRDALRAASTQPGLAMTAEARERGVFHAKMDEVIAQLWCTGLAAPDTMEFNEEQKQRWAQHTATPDTPAVANARMRLAIVERRTNVGVLLEGQLTRHEAITKLSNAVHAQTSQALRTQNPLGYAIQMAKSTVGWVSSLFTGVRLQEMSAAEAAKFLANEFRVAKSPAFERLEKQGGSMHNVVIALLSPNHHSEAAMHQQAAFLGRHAGPGDVVLLERIDYEDGRQRTAAELRFNCHAPRAQCKLFVEPGETLAAYNAALKLRRSVDKTLNHMLEVLPKDAAARLQKEIDQVLQPQAKTGATPIDELMDLINPFMIDLAAEHFRYDAKFSRLTRQTNKAKNARYDATEAAHFSRTQSYWEQVSDAVPRLNGRIAFAAMGGKHGPEQRRRGMDGSQLPEKKAVPLSVYKGEEMAVLYLSHELTVASQRKDL